MKLNFFSSLLILLLVTMSAKGVVLLAKIQDQTKYTFVTQANSSLIETAYAVAEPEPKKEQNAAADQEEVNTHASNVATKPVKSAATNTNLPNFDSGFSRDEVHVLQDLSQRRKELDKEQETLDMRENVLKATENKLDQKVQELQILQTQVAELMKGYDAQENAKFQSLVKIYENMKPREAAKIFDELDMPMLIQIVTRMKEIRVAPIIASMNPSKAKELSIELSKQRSLD
jgi:flagellar motility protein MotE (MotC chaperone)